VAAKVSGAAVSFLLYVVLARTMTPEGFGEVSVILAWLAVGTSLGCFSAPLVLLRFVPERLAAGDPAGAKGVIRFALLGTGAIAAAMGVAVAGAIAGGLFVLPPDLATAALLAAALLTPGVLLLGLTGLLTGLKRAAMAELLVNVSRPALMVCALVALAAALQPPRSVTTVIAIYLAASIVMLAATLAYSAAVLPTELAQARPRYAPREWIRAALGFMGVSVAVAIHERIDLLIMGLIGEADDIAAYAVAVRFAQTVVLAASAAGAAMAPHLVERLADPGAGRGAVQELARSTARTILHVSLLALAGFALLGPLLLSVFGPHYEQAYWPLVTLAAGQAIAALAGPAAVLVTLAGRPHIAIGSLTAGIVANACLNVVLVPRFAAQGAAVATAAGMVCAAAVAWWWTRRRLGVDTSVFAPSAT